MLKKTVRGAARALDCSAKCARKAASRLNTTHGLGWANVALNCIAIALVLVL